MNETKRKSQPRLPLKRPQQLSVRLPKILIFQLANTANNQQKGNASSSPNGSVRVSC